MLLPLSVLPREFARSMAVAIRTSSGPVAIALRAMATLASKERHLGSMMTKSSGEVPATLASKSQAVADSPRPDADVEML